MEHSISNPELAILDEVSNIRKRLHKLQLDLDGIITPNSSVQLCFYLLPAIEQAMNALEYYGTNLDRGKPARNAIRNLKELLDEFTL